MHFQTLHFFAASCCTLLLMALVPSPAKGADGVPTGPEDYTMAVDDWWSAHPLNPANEKSSQPIVSPKPILNVSDYEFDIQKAIEALPEEGGTIMLPEGDYFGGFRIVGRKHIHLIGEGKVTIRGGSNFLIGSSLNLDYGRFCEMVARKESPALEAARDLPTGDIYLKNLIFDDSPVRLGSCRGILFDDCVFEKVENRTVGDKDARGGKVLRWYRPLAVTGIMGLQEIWFRGCDFNGHYENAYYLDGVQKSGAVNCRFAGVDHLWHNAILLFTNDDVSLDVNGNDTLDPFERRDVRYYIVDGCQFGPGYKRGAIAASGRDILVQNCTVDGPLESLLVINAKTSGKEIYYECFGVKVRNNTLNQVQNIVEAEGASNRPEKGLPDWWVWTKYEIGKFDIRDNRITGMKNALKEIPRDSEILKPHQIEDNGPDAPGAGE